MSSIATSEHKKVAGQLKNVLATYAEAEDLVNIGAYRSGSNPSIDFALSKIDDVNDFLMQDMYEKVDFDDTVEKLKALFAQEEES
jgi:flagellum-specific ATP synthase